MQNSSIKAELTKVEIDFFVNLIIDFEKTTDPVKIQKALNATIAGVEITIPMINIVVKERAYKDPDKLNLANFFK